MSIRQTDGRTDERDSYSNSMTPQPPVRRIHRRIHFLKTRGPSLSPPFPWSYWYIHSHPISFILILSFSPVPPMCLPALSSLPCVSWGFPSSDISSFRSYSFGPLENILPLSTMQYKFKKCFDKAVWEKLSRTRTAKTHVQGGPDPRDRPYGYAYGRINAVRGRRPVHG